jgi:hypothetical protein
MFGRSVSGVLALERNLDIHSGIVRVKYPAITGRSALTNARIVMPPPTLRLSSTTLGRLEQRYSFAWPMLTSCLVSSHGNHWPAPGLDDTRLS